MLLVLLLSLCKSCQISPFRIAHECFILESGCKSTHFPGNFQMFLKKSSIFKQKLIYIKRKDAFHKERAPPPAVWTSARLTEPRTPQGVLSVSKCLQKTICDAEQLSDCIYWPVNIGIFKGRFYKLPP